MLVRRVLVTLGVLVALIAGVYAADGLQTPTNVLNPASDLAGKTLVTAEGNRTITGTFTFSVPVLFATGTTGAPGVVGSADTTTGWGLSVASISGSLSGTQRFLLNNSGLTIYGANIVDNTGYILSAALGTGSPTAGTVLAGNRTWTALVSRGCDIRLSLDASSPVSTTNVTSASLATTIYVEPHVSEGGGPAYCGMYDGSATWSSVSVSSTAITIPATTGTVYDVFCFSNSGTFACDTPTAWVSSATPSARVKQNGVWVKSGATTRRLMGSFMTSTASSGQSEDSTAHRYVSNIYNRVPRPLERFETLTSWVYTTASYQRANANPANQVEAVFALAGNIVHLDLNCFANNGGAISLACAIGLDSLTTAAAHQAGMYFINQATFNGWGHSQYVTDALLGYHTFVWLEESSATGTTTWVANGGAAFGNQSGLLGYVLN